MGDGAAPIGLTSEIRARLVSARRPAGKVIDMDRGYALHDRYRLAECLGHGGMSVVWRAHDEVLGRDVAVKVLSSRLAADDQLVHRIHLEARAVAALRHPHIVDVYDYGQAPDRAGRSLPYVVMELVHGRSLEQLLSGGALPWRAAVLIAAQVAAALAAAHARGIVHRDVKPGNVMVIGAGVKLVDFGISASTGDADEPRDQLLGTPAYLAPERLDGGTVRAATDVYALGLLLYRSLTGHLPWRASTTTEMLTAHRYVEPAALPSLAGLPAEVAALCHRCLRKRPEDRPSADEVARALGQVVEISPTVLHLPGELTELEPDAVPTTAVAPSHPVAPTRRRWLSARRRIVLPLAGAAALLPAAALGLNRVGNGSGDQAAAMRAGPAVAAPAAQKRAQCTVRYAVRYQREGSFSAAVTLVNTGDTAMKDWRLSFTFPSEQRITRGRAARWQQHGHSVQAQGGSLGAGASATTGFDASYRDTASLPSSFDLSGTTCSPVLSVAAPTGPARPVSAAPERAAPAKAAPEKAAPEKAAPAPKGAAGKPKKPKKP